MNPIPFLIVLSLASGCTKPVVIGKDRPLPSIKQDFERGLDVTFEASEKALKTLGYEVRRSDPTAGILQTAWRPTRATSHYTEVFGQKDYGTVGSYYRLILKVRESKGGSEVEISAPVKSLAPHQRSTYREERKILSKIADLLRKDDFKMTNVGVE